MIAGEDNFPFLDAAIDGFLIGNTNELVVRALLCFFHGQIFYLYNWILPPLVTLLPVKNGIGK